MEIYLNPGNDGFWEAVHSRIYVDKTGLITCINEPINTEQKFVCVTRPRRFGKSMALKMLAAYYSRGCDSWELFAGFKVEDNETFQKNLNKYDVISLNIQQFLIEAKDKGLTEYLEQEVLDKLYEEYGHFLKRHDIGLAAALRKIYMDMDFDGLRADIVQMPGGRRIVINTRRKKTGANLLPSFGFAPVLCIGTRVLSFSIQQELFSLYVLLKQPPRPILFYPFKNFT